MTSLQQIRDLITSDSHSYKQKVTGLAILAENLLEYPKISAECAEALDKRIICDMYEGNAPYRPRYILPDYKKVLEQGSAYLELPPAENFDDALAFLLIMYSNTMSITGYPVYFGDLDTLLLPYVTDVSDAELYKKLKRFWISLDRMFPDAFAHTNLSPEYNRVAKTIFELERELLQVVPNISLKVDARLTSGDYLLDAIQTVFACGKPHFINNQMMVKDLGPEYAAVSCYNSLKIGGGSHTLNRLNLKEVALSSDCNLEQYLNELLPKYVKLMSELMAARINFLVEESNFFNSDWLVRENLISLDNF
jgi:YjjI family glycine radical enzyme